MKLLLLSIFTFVLNLSPAFAQSVPQQPCLDYNHTAIPLENETVLGYKTSLPNLQKKQVYVKGTLVKYMGPIRNQHGVHLHFIMALRDPAQPNSMADLIEISHSMNGTGVSDAPTEADLRAGPFYICGEYSTTNANGTPPVTKFTPSVTGAMIHFTHRAGQGHPSGFIFANGKTFGNQAGQD